MTDFPSYTLGTVSVSNGATAIVGDGTIWTGINARAGDTIVIGTSSAVIVDVTDDNNLKIDAWPFTTVAAGTSYKIVQNSPLRFVGGQAMADVSSLIAILRTNGLLWYLPDGYTEPDDANPPITAEEGQGILKIDTGAIWIMQGGSWVAGGTFKGISFKGAYGAGTPYVVNDVVTSAGNAYIVIAATTGNAPPNATYYSLLASKGDAATVEVGTVTTGAGGSAAAVSNSGTTGAAILDFTIPAGKAYGGTSTTSLAVGTGSKAFTTQSGLAYTNGARVRASSAANTSNWMEGLVTYSGSTLTMTSNKTNGSGTFADWNLNVVGEPGAGDLTSANNLSDLASATAALTNLGGTTVGKAVFTAVDAAAARTAIGTPTRSTADKVYFVSTGGSDSNNGLSPESAFLTLQTAVNAANPSGVVHVSAGTYALTASLLMQPGVQIIGTPGTIITQGSGTNLTTLINFQTNSANGSAIRGCTIDFNRANNTDDDTKVMVYIGSANDVVLEHNKFRNVGGSCVNVTDGLRPIVRFNDFQNIMTLAIGATSTISAGVATEGLFNSNTFSNQLGQHVIYIAKSHSNQIFDNKIEATQLTGTCNVSGSTVTWVSGDDFTGLQAGGFCIMSPGGSFTEGYILSVESSTSLTIRETATATGTAFVIGTGDVINIGNSVRNMVRGNEILYGASGGIVLHNFYGGQILLENVVENNNIYYAGGSGISVQGTSTAPVTYASDTTIQNNRIVSCGMGGAAVGSAGQNAVSLIDFAPTTVGSVIISGNRFQNEGGLSTMVASIYTSGVSADQVYDGDNISVSITGDGSLGEWKSYVPIVSAGSGGFGDASATGSYLKIGKTIYIRITITIVSNGTAAGYVGATLPLAVNGTFVSMGREIASTGNAFQAVFSGSGVNCFTIANAYPGGNGYALSLSTVYESA